jgi:hypothetical protein
MAIIGNLSTQSKGDFPYIYNILCNTFGKQEVVNIKNIQIIAYKVYAIFSHRRGSLGILIDFFLSS